MAIDPATYPRVTQFVFSDSAVDPLAALRRLNQGDAVFVSSVMAEKYGYTPGDPLWMKTNQGWKEFEVAAVVVDFYNQGMVLTGNRHDLRRYFRSNEISTLLINTQENTEVTDVMADIDAFYGQRYNLSLVSNADLREDIFTLLDQAFSMFDVMAVLAVAIASLGIVNTLTMNIMERRREIGMLRAIGMTRGQVVRMVLAEAGLMGLVGGGIGLGFGVLLSRIFLSGMTAMSGYKLDFIVPLGGVITSLIVALVVTQLAALYPAQKAAKTDILSAIQYE
jgi:putative ABC transport system permease protein